MKWKMPLSLSNVWRKDHPMAEKRCPKSSQLQLNATSTRSSFYLMVYRDWVFNWRLLVMDSNSNLQHLALFVPQRCSLVLLPLPFFVIFSLQKIFITEKQQGITHQEDINDNRHQANTPTAGGTQSGCFDQMFHEEFPRNHMLISTCSWQAFSSWYYQTKHPKRSVAILADKTVSSCQDSEKVQLKVSLCTTIFWIIYWSAQRASVMDYMYFKDALKTQGIPSMMLLEW